MTIDIPPSRMRPMADLVLRGALLMILLRFVVRAIGLVSLTITARILTPEDFGIIGTASIVTGLFAILQRLGVFDVLVRMKEVTRAHVRTAWTINIIVAALITLSLSISAPLAAKLLNEPRLADILPWLAFVSFITALSSPGQAMFVRNVQFGRDFLMSVTQKVATVGAVIVCTFMTHDYWGLVYGSLIGAVVYAALSYVIVPFPVWPTLMGATEFFRFSAWTLAQAVATYIATSADEIAVRRTSSAEIFGLYHASRDLSRVLVSEFVAPTARPVMAGLARLQDEEQRFVTAALQASGVGAIVAISCSLGVSAAAPEIIALLLGSKWTAAGPFLMIAAIGVGGQTLAGLHRSILASLGRQDLAAKLWIARACVLSVAMVIVSSLGGGALQVAITFTVLSISQTILDYCVIFRILGRRGALQSIFLRPVLAGAVMFFVLHGLTGMGELPLIVLLVLKVAIGVVVFSVVLLVGWVMSGRPNGAETALINRCPETIRRWCLRHAP